MDDDGWSPYFVLICDDIRLEVTGKQLLIGAYSETIIIQQVPVTLPSLAFRVAVRLTRTDFKLAQFEIADPGGNVIGSSQAQVVNQTKDEYVTFVFGFNMFVLPHLGEYSIRFGMDGPLRDVGRLVIRVPATEPERAVFGI